MNDKERIESELLDRLINNLSSDESDLESRLRENPESAQDLSPLVEFAKELNRSLAPDGPDEFFIETSTKRIANLLSAKEEKRRALASNKSQRKSKTWFYRPAFAMVGLLVLFLLVASSAGAAYASSEALPGDPLYAVKRGLEEARLGFNLSPEGDLELLTEFASSRLEEVDLLLQEDRADDATQALDIFEDLNQRASNMIQELQGNDQPLDSADLLQQLSHQQARLYVLTQSAPVAAQTALQHALMQTQRMRSELQTSDEDREQRKETPARQMVTESNSSGPPVEATAQHQVDEERAEQIAKSYKIQVEEVWRVYQNNCETDWGCVREHFKNQENADKQHEKENRTAARLAMQYGVDEVFVMQIFEEVCTEDWKCVRQVLRDLEEGNSPPRKTPKPKN